MSLFTPRPQPTPLTKDTVRFNRQNEFTDIADTQIGRIVADAINQPQEVAS